MDIVPVDIELVSGIDEDELSEFIVTEPVQLTEGQHVIGSRIVGGTQDDDEELIKQFLDGKLSFSDYKVQALDEELDSDESAEDAVEDRKPVRPSSSKDFESELDASRRDMLRGHFSRVATSKEGKKKKSVLPPALQGLMGEANLRYARGDNAMAEKVCLEIIRQMPLAVEPYQTLAQIYEGVDQEKSIQFMYIAGHLNPSDVDHWIRLAEISEEGGNLRQAIHCYCRAIKASPNDIDIRLRRIDLTTKLGEEKKAWKYRLLMIRYIQDPAFALETAKEVAKKYHEMGSLGHALFAFRSAHENHADHFSMVDVNLYLELLIEGKLYDDALNILGQHTQINIEVATELRGQSNIVALSIPQDLIPDFRTKACVCLIHLKASHLYAQITEDILLNLNIEDDGDCVLDVAEAFIVESRHEEALQLLQRLVESKKFSLAAVFLRYADCLRILGHKDLAIESYRKVVALAPQHLDARLTLSALLKQKNQHAEALKALEQDLESDILDPTLLYEHCYMLKETGNIDQYIDLSSVLILRHCIRFRNREEVEIAMSIRTMANLKSTVKEYRENRLEEFEDAEGPEFIKSTDEPDVEAEYELFKDVVRQCLATKRLTTMQNLTHAAMTSKRFQKYRSEIMFMALISCIYNRDYVLGAIHCKDILVRHPANRRAWNLYIANFQWSPGTMVVKYSRFIQRFLVKEAEKIEPMVHEWKASYNLAVGGYQAALYDAYSNYKANKTPFSLLLLAVSLSHRACQRFVLQRSDYINQAIVFMGEYAKFREPEAKQEIYYNMGRLYHQFGLTANAIEYYQKVLACEPYPDPRCAELLDLKMEAAFNLHLIYKESGNLVVARKYLYDYIVI